MSSAMAMSCGFRLTRVSTASATVSPKMMHSCSPDGGWNHFSGGGLTSLCSTIPSASAQSWPTVNGMTSPVNPYRCSTSSVTSIASRLSNPSWMNVVSAVFSSSVNGRLSRSDRISATASFVAGFTFPRSRTGPVGGGGQSKSRLPDRKWYGT